MNYLSYISLLAATGSLWLLATPLAWGQARTLSKPLSSVLTIAQTSKYTGIVKQVDDIAEKITVRIDFTDGEENANGSGVIIGKQGNTYYVATACHVVYKSGYGTKCTTEHLRDSFTLTTPDGEKHSLKSAAKQIIIFNPDFDVAVIKFTSDKTYQVAELGDYQLEMQWVFVSGFPEQDANKQRRLTAGMLFVTKDSAQLLAKDKFSLFNGNELLYTNISFGGMSGGAVLDTEGRVIGINTGSENEVLIRSEGKYQEVTLGFGLGVSMTTFLGLASREKEFTESTLLTFTRLYTYSSYRTVYFLRASITGQ
jgi:S1-C subfamily serine protease